MYPLTRAARSPTNIPDSYLLTLYNVLLTNNIYMLKHSVKLLFANILAPETI